MNLNEMQELVLARLGNTWRVESVESRLAPGKIEGAPTEKRVIVQLSHAIPVDESVGMMDGNRLIFQGEGGSIEDALSTAFGEIGA